jgi:predicted Zn-dependent protease
LAKPARKKGRVHVKDMKFKNDPMIRLYERTQEWLQEQGRLVLIVLGVIVGLVIVYMAADYFFSSRKHSAQMLFSDALEKYNAPVLETIPANQVGKAYSNEDTKWKEAGAAFELAASEYPGYFGAKGQYYAGLSYIHIDKEKGIKLLEAAVNSKEQPTADLAKLALAERMLMESDPSKAIETLESLQSSTSLPKPAIQIALGQAYEKLGDIQKAAQAYVDAGQIGRTTPAGMEAEKRLKAIAPDRLKDLPLPPTGEEEE